jgi:uncharacterized protein YcaQ
MRTMARPPTLDDLRRHAVARSLFRPLALGPAIRRLGYVQADPMRAPARAQDLILRHRVKAYRAGDLERRYPRLDVEEDCLVNYGFLPREHLALMHPRTPRRVLSAEQAALAEDIHRFVAARGPTHPREVAEAFGAARTRGYWGGEQQAGTWLLDQLHYRGRLRVVRRDQGTRVYAAVAHPPVDESPAARAARADALLDLVLRQYAPLPAPSLGYLVSLLGYGAPHLRTEARAALRRIRERHPHALIDGRVWHWPAGESPVSARHRVPEAVRLLAPFDPVVWDRRRFELLWGWDYKFEAYVPAARRRFGHYALPLLWGERVIGWGNLALREGRLEAELGTVGPRPRGPAFTQALDAELAAMADFLDAAPGRVVWRR